MNIDRYQQLALRSAIYPHDENMLAIMYCALKLNGEAGEVAEKIGKTIRDNGGVLDDARRQALLHELGDVLWYISALADELDAPLSNIARLNLDKLQSRASRGTLQGNGDDR